MVGQPAERRLGPSGQNVEFRRFCLRCRLGRADNLINDGTEGSVESKAALGAAGLHKRGGRGGGRPSPQPSSGRGGRVDLPRRGGRAHLIEVEVARRLLLEPEPVVLRGLLQEVRRVLEDVGIVD